MSRATSAVRERRIRAILVDLIDRQQTLDWSGDDDGLRDANRLAIVYWQRHLDDRPIERSRRRRQPA